MKHWEWKMQAEQTFWNNRTCFIIVSANSYTAPMLSGLVHNFQYVYITVRKAFCNFSFPGFSFVHCYSCTISMWSAVSFLTNKAFRCLYYQAFYALLSTTLPTTQVSSTAFKVSLRRAYRTHPCMLWSKRWGSRKGDKEREQNIYVSSMTQLRLWKQWSAVIYKILCSSLAGAEHVLM